MSDMLEQLRAMQARVASLSPIPRTVRAHHAVPYGRVFRQWDTRGQLHVWVNRGQVADLPHRKATAPTPGRLMADFGIPVVFEPPPSQVSTQED